MLDVTLQCLGAPLIRSRCKLGSVVSMSHTPALNRRGGLHADKLHLSWAKHSSPCSTAAIYKPLAKGGN